MEPLSGMNIQLHMVADATKEKERGIKFGITIVMQVLV
jgi:hypothetical protein